MIRCYCDLREAISIEKRYFTSARDSLSVSFINFLDWNDFYISGDVIFAAKVQSISCVSAIPPMLEPERLLRFNIRLNADYGVRIVWCANKGHVAIAAE